MVKRLLKKLTEKIRKEKNVNAIILFGSYAKKRATPISDIDICVVLKKIDEKIKSRISALENERIQIVFWDEIHLALKFRVLKEGKVLYVKDINFLNSLKAETISRFLDFKPILERYYEKVYGWRYEI
jgi:predicted nucleotidyltransferase